jgi:hypothetical protein
VEAGCAASPELSSLCNFPANRENNREYPPFRGEFVIITQKLPNAFSYLRGNSLDSETGNFSTANRVLFCEKQGNVFGRALEADTPSIQLPRCDFSPLGRSIYLVGLIVATKLAYRHRCTFNKTRSRLSLYQLLQNFGVNRDYLWGGRDGSGTQSTHAAPPRVQTLSAGLRLTPDEWEVHRMETSPSTQ